MKRNWFSNFIPFEKPMGYQGLLFPTPEHFYQAMKTLDYRDRARCAAASSPASAKKLGQTFQLRADWDEIKLDVMEFALRYKFSSEIWLKRLRSESGPFVEWNYWHDNYWGHCTCRKCKGKEHLNHLGLIVSKLKKEVSL